MMYLEYVPLATFAVVGLLVPTVLACITFVERRRRHFRRQRRSRIFRPTVIEGGKVEPAAATLPTTAPRSPNAEAKSGRPKVRLSVLP
jgi:hypothetical protein